VSKEEVENRALKRVKPRLVVPIYIYMCVCVCVLGVKGEENEEEN